MTQEENPQPTRTEAVNKNEGATPQLAGTAQSDSAETPACKPATGREINWKLVNELLDSEPPLNDQAFTEELSLFQDQHMMFLRSLVENLSPSDESRAKIVVDRISEIALKGGRFAFQTLEALSQAKPYDSKNASWGVTSATIEYIRSKLELINSGQI